MRTIPNLGQVLGIRIRLHYTWPVAFVLITAIVLTQFPVAYPIWQRIILGIAASLLLFAAISIREFGLSFLAIRRTMSVKSITLFVFGGVSQIRKESTLPILELTVGVAGLLTNLIIVGIFYMVYLVLVIAGNVMIAGLIQWVAYICFMLALLHFIPGFPLDGGRLFRALIWKVTRDYDRATRIAGWTGWGIGLLFIAGGGLLLIFAHQFFVGLVVAFVGWGVQSAATQNRRQAAVHEALQNINARDIMTGECPLISQQLSIGQLVRDYILVTGQRYFIVVDGDEFQGIVTMSKIKEIAKGRWESTPVGKIMSPAGEVKTAHSQEPAANVLEQMLEFETDQMPVLEEGKVTGVVTRESLTSLVTTRAEIGA